MYLWPSFLTLLHATQILRLDNMHLHLCYVSKHCDCPVLLSTAGIESTTVRCLCSFFHHTEGGAFCQEDRVVGGFTIFMQDTIQYDRLNDAYVEIVGTELVQGLAAWNWLCGVQVEHLHSDKLRRPDIGEAFESDPAG
jgi:hypothetical protein